MDFDNFECEYLLLVTNVHTGKFWYDCEYGVDHGDLLCKTRGPGSTIPTGCPMRKAYHID